MKEKFDRSKPHINIGTIGHVDDDYHIKLIEIAHIIAEQSSISVAEAALALRKLTVVGEVAAEEGRQLGEKLHLIIEESKKMEAFVEDIKLPNDFISRKMGRNKPRWQR